VEKRTGFQTSSPPKLDAVRFLREADDA